MDKNKGVNRTFAKGGDMHMFQQQAAATRRPGKTGKDDARGPVSSLPRAKDRPRCSSGAGQDRQRARIDPARLRQMTPHPLITEDERRAYGDEALSVMERKAREVVGPVVNDLNRQNQQLRSELQRVKAHDIYSTLDQNMPNWREINTSQEFLDWLRVPDPCSGAAKSALLRAAFDSGDAGRVLAIFNGSLPSTRSSRPHAPRERPRTIRDQLSLPRTLTASMRTADAAFTTAKRSRRWPRKLKFMPLSCRGD